jgi:prevent-host-death family protein
MKRSRSVSVQELKENLSKFLRLVHDENIELEVTIHGEVAVKIVPVKSQAPQEELEAAWIRHTQLAEEISIYWPEGVSAVEAVREQRRDL